MLTVNPAVQILESTGHDDHDFENDHIPSLKAVEVNFFLSPSLSCLSCLHPETPASYGVPLRSSGLVESLKAKLSTTNLLCLVFASAMTMKFLPCQRVAKKKN
ncbi:hypothetical protein AMTR_s00175p00021410 [Amborella trichopoda]|uniref:Uncharacterized protein n=1 Tax=Amborella trichopoda TaxID=13333 RepID=U5CRU4_AMBTC|nr:hypothetical protein AMTR_s00175p00021410 [Amborella trichopoda]